MFTATAGLCAGQTLGVGVTSKVIELLCVPRQGWMHLDPTTYWEPLNPPTELTLTFDPWEVSPGHSANVFYLASDGTILALEGIVVDSNLQAQVYAHTTVGGGPTTMVVDFSNSIESGYYTLGYFFVACHPVLNGFCHT